MSKITNVKIHPSWKEALSNEFQQDRALRRLHYTTQTSSDVSITLHSSLPQAPDRCGSGAPTFVATNSQFVAE